MERQVTGSTIRMLREQMHLRQADLAERLAVSDKTVSKWETGRGIPDVEIIPALARELNVSVSELMSGSPVQNTNVSANMCRSTFYVCPVCGNVIVSAGEASVSCHGVALEPLEARPGDDAHEILVERVEDELYVHLDHAMSKEHSITFIAALSPDRVQLVRTYPEQEAAARFKIACVRTIVAYCNRDGLFAMRLTRRRAHT